MKRDGSELTTRAKRVRLAGLGLIVAGLLLNEWWVGTFLTHDGTFLLVTTEVTKGFDTLKMFGPEYFSRYRRKTSHGTGTKHVVQHNRRHRYGKFCGSPVG